MLGIPIIVARNTGMDKIVEKHNLGYVLDYGDIDTFESILKKIKNQTEFEKQSNHTRIKSVYQSYFSWEIMKERLQSIYKDLDKS
jgi:glycosyltransferase involved in cell wall biosynthesis